MKMISNHLGEVIAALAGIVVIICCVGLFHAPIGDFFTSITTKLLVSENDPVSPVPGEDGEGEGEGTENQDEYVFAVKVDGSEVSGDSKTVNYDGVTHTVSVSCSPATNIKYKVNGVEVSGALSFKSSGTYVIEYTAKGTDSIPKKSGIFTFVIGEPEESDYYTAEEIESSPYLMAIGRTDPSYVVAEFNEDFSSVRIFKNGLESDGIICDFGNDNGNTSSSAFTNAETNLGEDQLVKEVLTSAVIEAGVTRIGKSTFEGCSLLSNIEISNSVTSFGASAFSSTGIETLDIPSSVINIEEHAFYGCDNLDKIIIPNTVRFLGNDLFAHTNSSFTVDFPDSIKRVPGDSFYMCNNPDYSGKEITVNIPSGVTTIGGYAFYEIRGKIYINLPNTITNIEGYAFYSSSQTQSSYHVTFNGTKAEWNSISKSTNWENAGRIYVKCTDAAQFVI